MLNAFSRDIRSVRAQETLGVPLGLPCSSNIFPKKRSLLIVQSSPSVYGRSRSSFVDQRASSGGTKRTSSDVRSVVVNGRKADIAVTSADFRKMTPSRRRPIEARIVRIATVPSRPCYSGLKFSRVTSVCARRAILAPINQQRLGARSRKSSETKPRASRPAPALLDCRGQALSVAITGRILSNSSNRRIA
jgi:hypothetical protein